jgi:hypothetical protein
MRTEFEVLIRQIGLLSLSRTVVRGQPFFRHFCQILFSHIITANMLSMYSSEVFFYSSAEICSQVYRPPALYAQCRRKHNIVIHHALKAIILRHQSRFLFQCTPFACLGVRNQTPSSGNSFLECKPPALSSNLARVMSFSSTNTWSVRRFHRLKEPSFQEQPALASLCRRALQQEPALPMLSRHQLVRVREAREPQESLQQGNPQGNP